VGFFVAYSDAVFKGYNEGSAESSIAKNFLILLGIV
jgi:hypothetical protein